MQFKKGLTVDLRDLKRTSDGSVVVTVNLVHKDEQRGAIMSRGRLGSLFYAAGIQAQAGRQRSLLPVS